MRADRGFAAGPRRLRPHRSVPLRFQAPEVEGDQSFRRRPGMDTIQAGRPVVVTTYNGLALARGGLGRGPQARLRPVSCRIYRHDRQEGSVRSGKANALFGVQQVFRIPRVVSSGSVALEWVLE